jgi:hypothetical protein
MIEVLAYSSDESSPKETVKSQYLDANRFIVEQGDLFIFDAEHGNPIAAYNRNHWLKVELAPKVQE